MAEPYVGEIRLFANNYAPQGWALCNGQTLSIMQNQALYSLLGTTYGGDGKTTFGLPDLRGRVPIHFNSTFPLGDRKGEETHTLTTNEMPAHVHLVNASSTGAGQSDPTGMIWAAFLNQYQTPTALSPMNTGSLSNAGNGQAHSNMQPYLALNFCIALTGVYPTRN